jgi:hypothetical protein
MRPQERWTRPWADFGCSTVAVNETPHNPGAFLLALEINVFYLQMKEKAERVGFEPTRRLFTAYAISSRAP